MFKTTKAKIIFVIIFSILCIIITTLCIIYKNIEIEEENVIEENVENLIKEENIKGIDLTGKYNQNDIFIEEKKATKEKVEVSYCQISGLKNKTIENKINREIEQFALNCYKDQIKDLNNVVNVSVNLENTANFENTLSFSVSYFAKVNDNSDDVYQNVFGLNYDLTTGEKITLENMFTPNAPIENILRSSAYYGILANKAELTLAGDLVVEDYSDIEEEVAEFIYLYKMGELTEFYYNPASITIRYDMNKIIEIKMVDYPDYIAIYNRYVADVDLYEEDSVGLKNLYTLTTKNVDYATYYNYQNEKNYYIEINIVNESKNSYAETLINQKIKDIEAEIEKVKKLAKENENTFYILNYYTYVSSTQNKETNENLICFLEKGNSYEMTVHDFEVSIEPVILEYNRSFEMMDILDYVYDFENLLKIAPQETYEYYHPETGEKIVI